MTKVAERIFADAMSLDSNDRADLIEELVAHLNPSTGPQYVAAWDREIENRIGQIERGESKTIPWRQAIEQISRGEFDADE